jgi:hypothetical protein
LRYKVSVALVLVIIIFSSTTLVFGQDIDQRTIFIPSNLYSSTNLFDNTELHDPVGLGASNPSGEFSFQQDVEAGTVTLSWTHVAGTELIFNMTNPTFPVSREYSLFSIDFSWEYNVLPTQSNLSMSYSVSTTGDFQNDNWPGLYEIWTWFVYPDGTWERIYSFYGGADVEFNDWEVLGDWATDGIFQSLIDAEPDAHAELVVGLAPSWRFLEYGEVEPWRTYNGTVSVTFSEVCINSLYRTQNDFPDVNTPIFDTIWNQGDSDSFQDSCLTPDGKSLIITSYETANFIAGSSLTLLDERAEVVWRKSWNGTNPILWHDVGYYSDTIYLLGNVDSAGGDQDIQLMALNMNGEILWYRDYDYAFGEFPKGMAISAEGDIYIGFAESGDRNRNHLLKVDREGNVDWEQEFSTRSWNEIISIGVSEGGHVYTLTRFELTQWTEYGEQEWIIEGYFEEVCVLSDGTTIATQNYRGGAVNLTKFDVDGGKDWSQIIAVQYSDQWYDYADINSIAEAYDGTIYLLLALRGFHPGRVVIQLDTSGNHLGNTTVAFSEELYMSFDEPQYLDLHVGTNDMIYLFGRILDENWDYSITMSIFDIDPLILGTTARTRLTSIAAASILIGTIIIWHFYQKRKGSP